MANLTLAYKARSYSTGTLGRAICNARTHHFVADDAGGEELGAGEFSSLESPLVLLTWSNDWPTRTKSLWIG